MTDLATGIKTAKMFDNASRSLDGLCCLVCELVKSVTPHPDAVRVHLVRRNEQIDVFVTVARQDLGYLTGTNAHRVGTIQVIVNAAGIRNGHQFHLCVLANEDEESTPH